MKICQSFHYSNSIDDALAAMRQARGAFAVLAGGTDLLLDIQQGRHPVVDTLVDVSNIPELSTIEVYQDHIYLGAGVTHKQIISSQLLLENAQCVVEGCGLIGGPQVRNVATIGGNVSHALPAGDGTISLLALDTQVEIASIGGRRWEPLLEIFAGPGKVTFDRQQELVTRFRFNKRLEREGSTFHRVMRPQGVAIAILNMSGWVKLDDSEHLADVRIACGPAGPKPFRGFETESFLRGKCLDETILMEAARVLDAEVNLRTSKHRATKDYRHSLLPVLLKQVLLLAVSRAKENRE
ncbi:MAG: FAD binding domain-containing protein [Anaerolineales bacterium]|nr:FAD binding domain-containing protein [Anaerolineales bacterium]